MSIVTERAIRSVQRFEIVLMTTLLPFSSAIAIGVADTPESDGRHICSSGKARPIRSASTTGRPSCAASVNGVTELRPPASAETVCVIGRPRYSSSALNATTISSPAGSFSTMIVGAPIIAAGTTSASSGTSSGSTTVIGPCSSIACRASSVPT